MTNRKRALGLDVGTKTIGVAATDELGFMAHPVTTVARRGVKKDVAELVPLCNEREITNLVVGLPLELDGSEERPARLARQVGEALSEATGLPLCYVDERFTSVEAERMLIEVDVSRKKRKEIIDQQAACVILQSWLNMGSPDE